MTYLRTERGRAKRYTILQCFLLLAGMLGFTYDMHGQITSYDNAGPLCSGGVRPIVIYECNSGAMDVDCGGNDGCLSYLLAKCSQKLDEGDYIICIQHTVAKCQSNGYLRPFDAGNILGCAYTSGYKYNK